MHRLVVGQSGSGKSSLVRERIIPSWKKLGRPVLVLDPQMQPWGAVDYQTDDSVKFLEKAQASRGCILIIDECDESLRASADLERKCKYLATRSRNDGHLAYFIAQRTMQCPPSYRNQCSWGYIFSQISEDADECRKIFNCEALLAAPSLPLGSFIFTRPGKNPVKYRLF